MRLYGVEPDGKFKEFVATPFQHDHEEAILEDWLEHNPDGIVEDGSLLIIGRQVNTNLNSTIDLLALDRGGNVVVIELKRDRTPRETLAQALEYASFAERLDAEQLEGILRTYMSDESLTLADYHRGYFELAPQEAVSFNKDQRIFVVGQRVTSDIRQTASFLRAKGIRVTCVEFSFFQADGGTKLLSQEIVVGNELPKPQRVSSGSLPVVTLEAFITSLDKNGALFERILDFARERSMPVHWGTKGFSLNADLDGSHVVVCFGFPPASVYGQSLYTAFFGHGSLAAKTAVPGHVGKELRETALATGLFRPAGRELRCSVNKMFSIEEIDRVLSWLDEVASAVKKYGLKAPD
ncbi:MAG: hypothetical protein HYX92_16275 [Chloroflexi bacterium]|nr:hypothetical protein [Chloroflexota bacterium]